MPTSRKGSLGDWDPPELCRLRGALAELRFEAFGAGRSPGMIRDSSNSAAEWSDGPDANAWRARRRRDLSRLLERFDRLATDIARAAAAKTELFPRCRRCTTDVQVRAEFCPRCGASVVPRAKVAVEKVRPNVPTLESDSALAEEKNVAIAALARRIGCEPSIEGLAAHYKRAGLPAPSPLALADE